MTEATTKTSVKTGSKTANRSFLDSPRALPIFIALAALLLRLWGIGWGLPNDQRLFSYHPDESVVVSYSLAVNPLALKVDPNFYNYGSLSLLINGLVIHLGEAIGLVREGPGPGVPSPSALLMARLVTTFLAGGTCLFLFGIGRLLYGRTAGAVAGALYATVPLAVQHGHFATVDVPAVFWIAGALYFAVRYTSEEQRPYDLLWCGLWSGLAAATKYNAGLVLLAGIVAWIFAKPGFIGMLLWMLVAALVGFLLGCPGVILNFPGFWRDFQYESNHVREGHGDVFDNTAVGFVYHIFFNLGWGLGWPLLIVAVVGIGFAVWRRKPGDLALLAFLLPYYLLIGMPAIQIKFARYTLPMFPVLLAYAGALVPAAWKEATRAGRAAMLGIGAAAAYALVMSVGFNTVMGLPDPREQAASFIKQSGVNSVGFEAGPWFSAPALGPLFAASRPDVARQSALTVENPRLIPSEWNGAPVEWSVDLLKESTPDAVAISEFNYADALRVSIPQATAFVEEVRTRYPNRHVFAQPVQAFGLPITKLEEKNGLPVQGLPHDMLYTNPTTIVYTK
jgi:hypothetical protein